MPPADDFEKSSAWLAALELIARDQGIGNFMAFLADPHDRAVAVLGGTELAWVRGAHVSPGRLAIFEEDRPDSHEEAHIVVFSTATGVT